jgi:MATE family multidrug resistance protein
MMMGWLGSVPLAGHQIALTLASITFMVPLGSRRRPRFASARPSARRTCMAPGVRRSPPTRADSCSWDLGLDLRALPCGSGATLQQDPEVVRMGAALLMVGAAFQIFDGGQTIGIGALRGAADTRRADAGHESFSYWGDGQPLGWLLAFRLAPGPRGSCGGE